MVKKLNATENALAEETAAKYYKYECMATHHSSIIRAADSAAQAEAHATYVARCRVPEGFTPPSSEMDYHIDFAERTAERQCNFLLEFVYFPLSGSVYLIPFLQSCHCCELCYVSYAAVFSESNSEKRPDLLRRNASAPRVAVRGLSTLDTLIPL